MAEENKKTILVVEDDTFLVRAYKVKFGENGFDVLVASTGEEAMAYLEKDPVDLVLLDIMLPVTSGFDVLKAIRSNAKWGKVPVIVLSNLGQEQDIEKGKALGANDYIVKTDVKINDIVGKVMGYLKN